MDLHQEESKSVAAQHCNRDSSLIKANMELIKSKNLTTEHRNGGRGLQIGAGKVAP
jgi:hypothetical protein